MNRILLLAVVFFIVSCGNDKNKPDVSHIKVDISIERFEQDFFRLDTSSEDAFSSALSALAARYPEFYPTFSQHIVGVSPDTRDKEAIRLLFFIRRSYHPIYDSLQKKYPNVNWLEKDLESSFRFVKYYFPEYKIPKVATYIGTFDMYSMILSTEYLGIGLHQYAGKDFSVYQADQIVNLFPLYISRRFDKEYIVANCMKAIADDIYPYRATGKYLIEQMVEKGKHWYLADHFTPDEHDSLVTGYTKKQLDWLDENEGNAWAYVVKNENLYSIDPETIQTYIGESPYTQSMSEASPGNIGQWFGWRIVEKFASKNRKLSLKEVLSTPAKKIFEEAGYRPK